MATGPRLQNLSLTDRRALLRAEWNSSLSYAAFASLPWYTATASLDAWFDKYVYTPRVRELLPTFRAGQRLAATLPTSVLLTSVYFDLTMLSKPSARPWIYRPASTTARWLLVKVMERYCRTVLNLGITTGAHWAKRLGLRAAIALIPYVGWVVNGVLLYLDYQLVSETWRALYNMRDNLIDDLLHEVT